MVDYISKFEAEEIDELLQKAKECGSGGGIIDVTELPTENIDENAVYRVTENIQVEKTEIYIGAGESAVTLSQYLASLGVTTVPNMYVVDELPPDMKVSDVQTFSELHLYILKSDGIAYLNVPAYGGIITVGLFGFQAMGYDKGFTEDINAETEDGVYTTIEAYKQVVRWFIRENGEWKEITAYIERTTPHGFPDYDVVSGNITSLIPPVSKLVSGELTEITEDFFRSVKGEWITNIKPYAFARCNITSVTIPRSIYYLNDGAFANCDNLTTVTFEGSQMAMFGDVFSGCDNLTTINVPWSVDHPLNKNAPWGATNATINYNYTEG